MTAFLAMLQLNHKRHSSGDYVSVLGLVCYLQTNFFLRFPRYNNQNTSSRVSNPTTGANKNIYSYGNYYTWAAAIANIGDENSGNTSICPNGWRLPNGGNKTNENTNDYWNLVVVHLNSGTRPANYESEVEPYYDDSTEAATVNRRIRSYPNNFVLLFFQSWWFWASYIVFANMKFYENLWKQYRYALYAWILLGKYAIRFRK